MSMECPDRDRNSDMCVCVCVEKKTLFVLRPCAKHSPHTGPDWVTHAGVCDTRLYITSRRVWGSVMQFACHGDPVASLLSPTTGVLLFFLSPLQTQCPYFSSERGTADRTIIRLLVTALRASQHRSLFLRVPKFPVRNWCESVKRLDP